MAEATLRQEEVVEELASITESDKEALKRSLVTDLYAFSKGVCGYQDVNVDTHGAFCKFLEASPKERRLGLMPRTHLKSTIGTVADSLRLALADPDDFSELIVGEIETTATKFLFEIKQHVEQNPVVHSLWPESVPSRFSGPGVKWSTTEASLQRSAGTVNRAPSWTAIGVGGAVVGSHFRRIKCDDLIGFEAFRSPATMKATIAWVDNIEPLLIDQHADIIDWIGTRWSVADLYSHIMETYGSDLAVFTRSAIENGQIIFPQLHTWKEYQRLQTKTPAVWFAQYVNNPMAAGGTDFNIGKVGHFQFSIDGLGVEFVDPLTGRKKEWLLRDLDIVLAVDPNSGSLLAPDMAAIAVVGMSPDHEAFSLHMWSGRVTPSALVDQIFEIATRWRPRKVGIEKAGQQNTQHYFEKKMMESDVKFIVTPLNPNRGRTTKEDRIRGNLEPVFNSQRFFTLPGQTQLRKQIADFPQNARYDNALIDELDAVSYAVEEVITPQKRETDEVVVRKLRLLLRRRSSVTGY